MKAWGDGPAPFDLTESIACPVIGFSASTTRIPRPPTSTRSTRSSRATAKPTSSTATRAPATRSSTSPAERYRPDQAKDAWSEMLEFLSRHLKGRPRALGDGRLEVDLRRIWCRAARR